MRPRFLAWSAVLAAMLIMVFLVRPRTPPTAAAPSSPVPLVASRASAPPPDPSLADPDHSTPAPFAERILADYASPSRPPQDDLRDLARTLENFTLLLKGDNPLPLGANEEIAAALRGKNRAQLRALPDDHRAFNAQGQLVDRWQTPIYFHAESRDRIDLRSAGPDRVMWTADDLHRQPGGRFLRGEALLPSSLLDAKRTGP